MPKNPPSSTLVTELLGIDYPIIGGPMFLVSNIPLVTAVSEAGAVGGIPSLNWRTADEFRSAVREIKSKTKKPFAVNLIVNQANPRLKPDLEICAEEKVPLVITSLGNPKDTIRVMHEVGCKVFCDVVNLEYSKKVQDQGADGVVAVSSGAGGHAGPTSPLVLIPYLKRHLSIPIIAAGGITTGSQIAAALILGASAVQVGTRFIASTECAVGDDYKNAILNASPDDIVLTKKISGTPLAVIRTPYTDSEGYELSKLEEMLLKNPRFKKYIKMARTYIGSERLKAAVGGTTYKQVWSAGQGVGLIDEILPAKEIIDQMIGEYWECVKRLA
jgi:nitronate monooxygenase